MERFETELAAAFAGRWPFHYLEETDSTNTQLKRMALEGAPARTVLIADRQTAGRGRKGRAFFSPGGSGLYFSVLLRDRRDPLWITVAAGVAAARAIQSVAGAAVKIKWVNDLFLADRKVAGILAETASDSDAVILGIGVNAFAPAGGFGALENKAGALWNTVPDDRLRARLCAEILAAFFEEIPQKELLREYRARAYLTGRQVTAIRGGEVLQGKAEGIGDRAELLLRTPDGKLHALISGEVTIVH